MLPRLADWARAMVVGLGGSERRAHAPGVFCRPRVSGWFSPLLLTEEVVGRRGGEHLGPEVLAR